VNVFYQPTDEHIAVLDQSWNAAYSGGKDSTSLVTWVEWLRRSKRIVADNPILLRSNTTIEDCMLDDITREMESVLRASGWTCIEVTPAIHEKMFNRILGIGNAPIHPGGRTMRWCTRATKIDPMERYRKQNEVNGLTLTGLRFGESDIRDEKLLKTGCVAGGECGIPPKSERTYSPIVTWKTCNVMDWLNGAVDWWQVRRFMDDIHATTRKLVKIYNVRIGQRGLADWNDPEVSMARFGCIGCPAICAGREAPNSVVRRYGADHPLTELYDVWYEARRMDNRCIRRKAEGRRRKGGKDVRGPIRMAVRKVLFERVMDIQRRAGVVLVTPEDEAFIRQCWAEQRYPRGWSAADELTKSTELTLLPFNE